MQKISLPHGIVTVVDDDDYEYLSRYCWCLYSGYAGRGARSNEKEGGRRRSILMHRVIMNTPRGMETDHKDGNRLNNQRSNLRICTYGENMANILGSPKSSSGFFGVSWDRRAGKWMARIQVNKKFIFVGYFRDSADAARARDTRAIKEFGEFARLNFPDSAPAIVRA